MSTIRITSIAHRVGRFYGENHEYTSYKVR